MKHAADSVKTRPAEVRLEGKRVVVKAGDVEVAVEFKLLKNGEVDFLPVKDIMQTLAL